MNTTRVLIAKPGLDGHDRGAKVLALALRDASFEVIYTGVRQTPKQIVDAVIQEDPSVLLLSSLSGAHLYLFEQIFILLVKAGLHPVVLAGGIIPLGDYDRLCALGVAQIFGPSTDPDDVIQYINSNNNNSPSQY
jgi:methylmalonyl-CoA mutase C-terminal domain/subunit